MSATSVPPGEVADPSSSPSSVGQSHREPSVPSEPRAAASTSHTTPPVEGSHGALGALGSLVLCIGTSLALWWVLIDPRWGALDIYGNHANALIFWALFAVVCLGFNLEGAGFTRLPPVVAGLSFASVVVVFAVVATSVLAEVWGRVDTSFAATRDGGQGYFTGAIFVLFVFVTNVPAASSFEHAPWSRMGLRQPWVGLIEIATCTIAAALLYAAFALPALASWSESAPVMSVDRMIGAFYSVVVVIIVCGNQLDNWPWSACGRWRPVAWLATCATGGAVLFIAMRWAAGLLLGEGAASALGPGLDSYAAQLGVCWVFWSIFWSTCANNWALGRSGTTQRFSRVAVTLGLGVVTFVSYYRFFADAVLHEPAAADSVAGNALGFVDLVVLVLLIHVVGFRRWPFVR